MVSFWQGALVTALVAVTYQYQQGDLSFEATLRQLERRHPVSSSYGGYQTQYPAKYDYYRNVYPNEDSWDDDDEYRSRPMCVNMPRPNTFVSLGESSFLEMELEPLYPGWHIGPIVSGRKWVYPLKTKCRSFSPEGCGQIGTVTVDYVMFPVPILDVTMKLDDPDFGIFQYNAYIGKTYSRTCDSKKFENPLSLSRTTQYFHESPRNIITARYSGDGRTVCGYWSSLHSRWNQNITVRPVLKSDPPAGAFIYSRSCFRGTRLDITSDRVIPDWFIVKSLRVTPGFNVTLFVNSDFSGYRQTFAEDVSSFTGTAFARYVGSVRMPLKNPLFLILQGRYCQKSGVWPPLPPATSSVSAVTITTTIYNPLQTVTSTRSFFNPPPPPETSTSSASRSTTATSSTTRSTTATSSTTRPTTTTSSTTKSTTGTTSTTKPSTGTTSTTRSTTGTTSTTRSTTGATSTTRSTTGTTSTTRPTTTTSSTVKSTGTSSTTSTSTRTVPANTPPPAETTGATVTIYATPTSQPGDGGTLVIEVDYDDTQNTVTVTKTVTVTTNPAPSPTCIEFGPAKQFNVFVAENYEASSDAQGKVAVGGNATFAAGYSIADQLTDIDLCNEDTLIVGCHLLSWPSGRNYFGNIAVGELQSNADELFRPILDTGCTIREEQDVLRFAEIHSGLMELSTAMSSWSQTIGDMRVVFGDLKFSYSGLFNIEVVTVTDPSFLMGKVKRIMLPDNHRANTVLVFNIYGASTGITDMNMEYLKGTPVIFNFVDAKQVTIRGVGVRGWVLAPHAAINDATGVVWGNIFAKSLSGPIQINIGPSIPEGCRVRLLDESTGLLVKDTNLAGYAPTPIRSTWSIYAVALLVFVLSVLAMTV